MSYAISPNLDAILSSAGDDAARVLPHFALVDAGQLLHLKLPMDRLLPMAATELLFEESFAKSALHLSPALLQLNTSRPVCTDEIRILDRACESLPVLTLLRSDHSLKDLAAHLRSALLIEAEESAYLFRFADSQMMAAMNTVLTPSQRGCLFAGIDGWWSIDHWGRLDNGADQTRYPQAVPPSAFPLQLDAAQTDRLLTAVAVPVFASQLRNLDPSFARIHNHAQQTAFAAECIAAGNAAGVDADSDLTSFALQRWNDRLDALTVAA